MSVAQRATSATLDDLRDMSALGYLGMTAKCFFIGIMAQDHGDTRQAAKVDICADPGGTAGVAEDRLLKMLAFDRDEWLSDGLPADLHQKDARSHLAGKLIVELAELKQLRGSTRLTH